MKNALLTLSLAASLGGCATMEPALISGKLDNADGLPSGLWRSDGYGYIVDFGNQAQVYNVAGDFCVALAQGQEGPMQYFDSFRLSGDRSELELSHSAEPYVIRLHPESALPASCSAGEQTALQNFDAFASFFAEHYAFFELYGVDWPVATQTARAELGDSPGDGAVVGAMIGLLSRLKDGHIRLSATVDGEEGEFIPYPGKTAEAVQRTYRGEGSANAALGRQYLRADIERDILGGQGQNAANERLKFGITSDDIGYIAVMGEGGYTGREGAPFADEIEALHPAMEEAIALFNSRGVKAVIVDLSVNQGGYDFLAREIARFFTSKRQIAYSKYAGDAQDQTPQTFYIDPSPGEAFVGPVYVMTSDMTVSAGELLTLSLRALPNVTHAGAPTRGALSDVLTKYLPNGWEVTLSNEVYLDHEGTAWEGRGVTPEIAIEVFDPEAPLNGHFPAVEELIALIDKRH
ncbi:S41 family peptidase [Altererythrobacter sp. ZODW24]|uniref:S41 family peptidase n=1 Tax=Altererythrobacter sp. ZODW24 TaxID=2185142 RepID=UPI0013B38DB4|nr:S41 family peptidase [Altererythrobacter sp. ZODW24]